MARPIKNSCDYFPHDNDMRNHRKIKSLRNKFGVAGYAIWSMILEYLTGIDGNEFEYSEMEFELMSGDFGVSVTEIRDAVDYCIKLELLFNNQGFIGSESLDKRLEPVYLKRGKAKEISSRQQRVNGKFLESTDQPVVTVTETPEHPRVTVEETPQSKVKETKVKKTIEERKVAFGLSLKDFENSYSRTMLAAFYNYWIELTPSGKKMKFELEQTWETHLRLAKWDSNEKKFKPPQSVKPNQQSNKFLSSEELRRA